LQEFTELVNDQNCLTAIILPNLEIVIEMIEKNIFRPLPILKKAPPPSEGMNAAEEDDILIDPSWAHFQVIFQKKVLNFTIFIKADLRIFPTTH